MQQNSSESIDTFCLYFLSSYCVLKLLHTAFPHPYPPHGTCFCQGAPVSIIQPDCKENTWSNLTWVAAAADTDYHSFFLETPSLLGFRESLFTCLVSFITGSLFLSPFAGSFSFPDLRWPDPRSFPLLFFLSKSSQMISWLKNVLYTPKTFRFMSGAHTCALNSRSVYPVVCCPMFHAWLIGISNLSQNWTPHLPMGVSQPDYCDSFLSSVTFSNLALNPFDLYLKKKKKALKKEQ